MCLERRERATQTLSHYRSRTQSTHLYVHWEEEEKVRVLTLGNPLTDSRRGFEGGGRDTTVGWGDGRSWPSEASDRGVAMRVIKRTRLATRESRWCGRHIEMFGLRWATGIAC